MRTCKIETVDGQIETHNCYTVKEFDFTKCSKTAIKTRSRKDMSYLTEFATFDIETTTIPAENPYGFMYHFQFCIGGRLLYGRTWEEFGEVMENLKKTYNTSESRRLVIYIHNAGFEYQFMRCFLDKYCEGSEVFAPQKRKPLRINTGNGMEFRCSWKLTNMSLEMACKKERNMRYLKAAGDLDYKKVRTSKTRLTATEFKYCMLDVLSLYDLIRNKLINERDTLETIPMTSTGYVRRMCRKSTEKVRGYRDFFRKQSFGKDFYNLCKDAGRGGDTHANRRLSGKIIHDVEGFDVQSSYPAMLCMKQYPVTKFVRYGEIESKAELNKLLSEKACMFRLILEKPHVKDNVPMPYISESKCKRFSNPMLDNGRIISADMVEIAVTDIDYGVIMEQYEHGDIYVYDMYIAEYGYLPDCLLDVVRELFQMKSDLKWKIEQAKKLGRKKEAKELDFYYSKCKNLLNGIFGMMYTDPVRDRIYITETGEWKEETPEIESALQKFFNSRNSFLIYAWGIWTTAHARRHLFDLVKACGMDNVIYCDTDSSYCHNPDWEAIEKANAEIIKMAEERRAYAVVGETTYYMGIYEHDKSIDRFKTLGAKKYAYEKNGKLNVTISGVSKELGAIEMKKLENFDIGFCFEKAGGNELVYNDVTEHKIKVNGIEMTTGSNIAMLDSTYIIGVTGEYAEVIGFNPTQITQKLRSIRHEKTRRIKQRKQWKQQKN